MAENAGEALPPDVQAAVAYIRSHRGRYPHDTVDAGLRQAGHADSTRERAWIEVARLDAEDPAWADPRPTPPQPATPEAGNGAQRSGATTFLIVVLLAPILVAALVLAPGLVAPIWLLSAIGMALDARSLGYEPSEVGGLAGMSPLGWFFAGLLLWFVALPLYLAKRGELKAAGERRRSAPPTRPAP